MLLRQLNFGVLLVLQLLNTYYKGKTPLFFYLLFLLLLSERGLSPESYLEFYHPRSFANKSVAYKKSVVPEEIEENGFHKPK